MELKPIIEVKNLTFSYPAHQVLKKMNFALYPGEVVSLLGPNGCGKSTLIPYQYGFHIKLSVANSGSG